jgi:hypothetical protein
MRQMHRGHQFSRPKKRLLRKNLFDFGKDFLYKSCTCYAKVFFGSGNRLDTKLGQKISM